MVSHHAVFLHAFDTISNTWVSCEVMQRGTVHQNIYLTQGDRFVNCKPPHHAPYSALLYVLGMFLVRKHLLIEQQSNLNLVKACFHHSKNYHVRTPLFSYLDHVTAWDRYSLEIQVEKPNRVEHQTEPCPSTYGNRTPGNQTKE